MSVSAAGQNRGRNPLRHGFLSDRRDDSINVLDIRMARRPGSGFLDLQFAHKTSLKPFDHHYQYQVPLTTNMQRSTLTSSGVSSLSLSSLALHGISSSQRSNTSSPTPSLSRGWGSAESRKACLSLNTLEAQNAGTPLPVPRELPGTISPVMSNGMDMDMKTNNWGFFVDAIPSDDDGMSW